MGPVTRLPTRRFRLDQIESNFRRTLEAFESGEPGSVPATLDSPLVRAYVRHSGKDFQTLLRSVGGRKAQSLCIAIQAVPHAVRIQQGLKLPLSNVVNVRNFAKFRLL